MMLPPAVPPPPPFPSTGALAFVGVFEKPIVAQPPPPAVGVTEMNEPGIAQICMDEDGFKMGGKNELCVWMRCRSGGMIG
ncbi:hypothetical protein FGO68_gene12844 [Halteria grandinella]|uniref:Uncharacterized protein n=1 Tax=Halteria grandinella TaxID=5974 RepID=A0A8J8SX45_HALGN|nr:hypothetical protein FGO68_gene12844 [Halteria grandinella]